MTTPNVLVLAGSLRSGSYNRQLASLVARRLQERGAAVTRLDLKDYSLPIYDNDLELAYGIPKAAEDLHEKLRSHRGVFIASPEYNANVSPLLINAIAWISRVPGNGGMGSAFGMPVYALGSASPGGFGGYRGLVALRNSLELQLGARVLPAMVSVGGAHEAFDETGDLKANFPKQMVGRLVDQLITATSV